MRNFQDSVTLLQEAKLTTATYGYYTLVPEFVGSNPAEGIGFFWAKNSSACLPSEEK
jgi:hypothetical protein